MLTRFRWFRCSCLADHAVPFYVAPAAASWCVGDGRNESAVDAIQAAATKAKKYGAVGCVITDLHPNGAIQPLSLSRVGFVVGAGCMWSGSSAQSLDDAMLGELLDAHIYRIPHLGRAAVDLLNAAPVTTRGEAGEGGDGRGRWKETSPLLNLVAFDGTRPDTLGLTTMMLNRTILQAHRSRDAFVAAQKTAAGAAVELVQELLLAADTVIFAGEFGSDLLGAEAKTGNPRCDVAAIQYQERTELATQVRALRERHRVWWQRRHLGSFEEAEAPFAHLEALLGENLTSGEGGCLLQ